jgi:hypothetical protein
MFEFNPNTYNANQFDRSEHVNHAMLLNLAVNLFNQARRNSTFEKIKCIFKGCSSVLLDLEVVPSNMIRARRYGGIKPVNIDAILGTLGRTRDFDLRFHPLDDRIRDRWVSIATARCRNIPLTPVELIQVKDFYFVKDGHHRISVSRALGESVIDAEVTIWEVCCALPWEEQPVTRIALTQTT